MSIRPLSDPKPRTGDYVATRTKDTESSRQDAERQLANNGCKAVRFEPLDDGRLLVHGYLRAG